MSRVGTYFHLGVYNLARVFFYKVALKLPFSRIRRLVASPVSGPFFDPPVNKPCANSNSPTFSPMRYFGWMIYSGDGSIPNWHMNPFTGGKVAFPATPWWSIPDFDSGIGDIKTVWEASRFDWAFEFAREAVSGHREAVERLNVWIADWCAENPFYLGPNWKCGQEASIRILHLAMTSLILGTAKSARPGLLDLVQAHLRRIRPTVSYALAQNNNHGTSEAAALFVGGSLLRLNGRRSGRGYEKLGRWLMENRTARLIAPDGSFSQHSVNYHRLMLDTFSFAEAWRRRLELDEFSTRMRDRLGAAAEWLRIFTDPSTGDVPNIGANDGAKLFPMVEEDCRDYRSSVQLAMGLFKDKLAYATDGSWNRLFGLFSIDLPADVASLPDSHLFDSGGYACLSRGDARAVLRFPRFKFRPSHADALHVDFWIGGKNMLRDGGSFSYNAGSDLAAYFSGTESHCTIQINGRDQMPRLGRFLWGDWLKARDVHFLDQAEGDVQASASYRDKWGVSHSRSVVLGNHRLLVTDRIDGLKNGAVLRWRLPMGEWSLKGRILNGQSLRASIDSNTAISRIEMIEGWESRYYLRKDPIHVLEVHLAGTGTISTKFEW